MTFSGESQVLHWIFNLIVEGAIWWIQVKWPVKNSENIHFSTSKTFLNFEMCSIKLRWPNWNIFWFSEFPRWVQYEKGKNILSETFSLGNSTTCAGNSGSIYLKDLNMAYVGEGQCLIYFFPILQNSIFTNIIFQALKLALIKAQLPLACKRNKKQILNNVAQTASQICSLFLFWKYYNTFQ